MRTTPIILQQQKNFGIKFATFQHNIFPSNFEGTEHLLTQRISVEKKNEYFMVLRQGKENNRPDIF